jgi:hypothetical protein
MLALAVIGFSAGVYYTTAEDGKMPEDAREARRAGLSLAQQRLRGAVLNDKEGWVAGRSGGFHVTYRLRRKESKKGARRWTEIDVAIPSSDNLIELELRPHEAGSSETLITGNPFYDTFYLRVDPPLAGPELFDMSFRKRLLDLHPIRLSQGRNGLRVEAEGWGEAEPKVKELITLSAALGERIGQVSERLARMGRRRPKKFRRWYR